MNWHAHVTVATVVEREGKFLMVEELSGGQRVFNQPAGHLDPGETLESAALRETLEETAWEIRLTGFLGVALYTAPGNGVTYLRNAFVAEPVLETSCALDTDILAAHWLSYEEILAESDRMRSPLVLATIDKYRRGDIYPLSAVYG